MRCDNVSARAGQTSERTGATGLVRQASRGLPGDRDGGTMSTAQSVVADNLPEPYQPPASNATSEDVHVGLGAHPVLCDPAALFYLSSDTYSRISL